MGVMLIETEATPNPATLKFLPGRVLMPAGTRDFSTPEAAAASPLAEALFNLGDVAGVFFGRDFLSVTIAPGSDWTSVKPEVFAVLLDHFGDEKPLFREASASGFRVPGQDDQDAHFPVAPEDQDIVDQIRDLIETRIRPAVGQDGGDIVFCGFDRGRVLLRMQGACAGCPSSSATLKQGVEQLLRHYVPEVTEVVQI